MCDYPFPVSLLISSFPTHFQVALKWGGSGHMGCGRMRITPRVGDSSVGCIVPLGGSDSAGSDSTLSLYSRTPRVVLVDVNHNVCDTHQVCATN